MHTSTWSTVGEGVQVHVHVQAIKTGLIHTKLLIMEHVITTETNYHTSVHVSKKPKSDTCMHTRQLTHLKVSQRGTCTFLQIYMCVVINRNHCILVD